MNREEKLILFRQILDIRLALQSIDSNCLPLRFGGTKEIRDLIDKLDVKQKDGE
jgi:hypothetical protein